MDGCTGGLAKTLNDAKPGDTLVLTGGRYEEPISLKRASDLRFAAAEGADVVLDGQGLLRQRGLSFGAGP